MRGPAKDRFLAKVIQHPSGCWIWNGSRLAKGYGTFRMGGVVVRAHRAAFKLLVGHIPDGMQVLHRCDNPPCVNPDHLFLGTNDDNVADKVNKGRQSRGVYYGGPSKLTAELVLELRRRFKNGESKPALASEFGISRPAVSRAINGTSWKNIGDSDV